MERRPNIIIFNPDEMRWDTMGHMGNPAAKTPFLDSFAKTEAVSFSRAFCQNPVCVPSRCSFFTGLYPHVNGHRSMQYLLHPGERSLFAELKEAGYYVWMNARNDLYAGQFDGWAEEHADEIFYGSNTRKPGPLHTYGPEYKYSHFGGELGVDEKGINYNADDESVDAAIERLRHPVDDRPICIFLGLMYPHTPYQVEDLYFSGIDRSKLPPRVTMDETEGKSKMIHLIHDYVNMKDIPEKEWDEIRATYLAMCTKVDVQFERLMAALKETNTYDDSAVFFLSDHGDFAGDYDLVEKAQSTMEDCLTRVPFLVKPPKGVAVDPGISDSLVELVDFYATAIDFAKADPQRTHFGKSLRPVLADRNARIREFVVSEGGRLPEQKVADEYDTFGPAGPPKDFVYWPKMKAQSDDEAHAKATMLRTEKYKYVSRITGEDELYDMEKDPKETHNLIHDPAYQAVLTDLRYKMLVFLQSTSDVMPLKLDLRGTVEMSWQRFKNMVPSEWEDEIKDKIRSGLKPLQVAMYVQKRLEEAKSQKE